MLLWSIGLINLNHGPSITFLKTTWERVFNLKNGVCLGKLFVFYFKKGFYFGKGFIFWKIIYIFEKGFSFWKIFSVGPVMLIPWLVKEEFPQRVFDENVKKIWWKIPQMDFFIYNKNLMSFWWKFPKRFFFWKWKSHEFFMKKKIPRSQEGYFFLVKISWVFSLKFP